MSAENRAFILTRAKDIHVGNGNGNGVSKELPNLVDFPLPNAVLGKEPHVVNGNGKKLNKVNVPRLQLPSEKSDKFAPPKESSDLLEKFPDTMLVSDFLKDAGGVQMFSEVFGATVSKDRRDISFSESGANIRLAPSERGNAILTFQNGDKTEMRSLNGWAIRDAELIYGGAAELMYGGPAVDLISPQRKDGTFEMFQIKQGKVNHKVVEMGARPSDPGEYDAKKVASELPRSEVKGENPTGNSYREAIIRDFPKIKPEYSASETAKRIQVIKQKIKDLRTDANAKEIQKVINSAGPLSEEELHTVEEFAAARFADILENHSGK